MIKPEWKPVLLGSPTWSIVKEWAELELTRLRDSREKTDSDPRKLDQDLGGINAMKELLALPDAIKKARSQEEIKGVDFGIPVPVKLWEDTNVSDT